MFKDWHRHGPREQTDRQMVPDLGYQRKTRSRDEDKEKEELVPSSGVRERVPKTG